MSGRGPDSSSSRKDKCQAVVIMLEVPINAKTCV
jgi:hypothetical protein